MNHNLCPTGSTLPERKETILNSAGTLLLSRDYRSITSSNIAKLAGVAVGTIFNHYESKKELFRAAIDAHYQRNSIRIEQLLRMTDSSLSMLEVFASFELQERLRKIYLYDCMTHLRTDGDPVTEHDDGCERYSRVFHRILQTGIVRGEFKPISEPLFAASLFFGTLERSSQTLRMRPDLAAQDVVRNLIDLFEITFGTKQRNVDESVMSREDQTQRLERVIKSLEQIVAQRSDPN